MRDYLFLLIFLGFLPLMFFTPFAGVLLWTWVSLMSPHQMTWGMLPLGYAQIIVITLAIAMLLSRERKLPPNAVVTWAFAGMMVFITIAHLNAYDKDLSYPRWDGAIKGLLLALVALPLINTKLRIQAYIWIIVLSLGFYGLKGGVFTLRTAGAFIMAGPPGTMIADNNHLATALAMVTPLMVYLALHSATRAVRIGCWIMALLTLLSAVFTYSRGGMLAIAAMLSVLWLRSSSKLPSLIVVIVFAGFVVLFAPDKLWERLGTIENYQEDSSAMGRITIWRVAIQLWFSHPLFGIGFNGTNLSYLVHQVDASVKPRSMHNSYLEVLTEAGAFAFFCHAMLIAASFLYLQQVRRHCRGSPEWLWAYDLAGLLQVGLVGYLVGGTFLSLGFYDGFWSMVIAATALKGVVFGAPRRIEQGRAPSPVGDWIRMGRPSPGSTTAADRLR